MGLAGINTGPVDVCTRRSRTIHVYLPAVEEASDDSSCKAVSLTSFGLQRQAASERASERCSPYDDVPSYWPTATRNANKTLYRTDGRTDERRFIRRRYDRDAGRAGDTGNVRPPAQTHAFKRLIV